MIDFARLQAPFPAHQVSWRLQQAGQKDGHFWARVVPYIDIRCIDDRLDEVCGPAAWKVEYRETEGSLMCGLSLLVDKEWVTKWDGTGFMKASEGDGGGLSAEDAKKGTYTVARRRAAGAWGIGRYIGHVPAMLATCYADERQGRFYGRTSRKDGEHAFSWDSPPLPAWALPEGSGAPGVGDDRQQAPPPPPAPRPSGGHRSAPPRSGDSPVPCLSCGGPQWDNRETKTKPRAPDLKCKDTRKCKGGVWMGTWEKDLVKGIDELKAAGRLGKGEARAREAATSKDPEKMYSVHCWILSEREQMAEGKA